MGEKVGRRGGEGGMGCLSDDEAYLWNFFSYYGGLFKCLIYHRTTDKSGC